MTYQRFFDSEAGLWPPGAQYAALYFDSSISGDGFRPQSSTIPNQRWITRRGDPAIAGPGDPLASPHTGIADFEAHNLVYTDGRLGRWARGRESAGLRARTYCNRSDVRLAFPQVGHLPNNVWWIATGDGNPHWTPESIVESVFAASGIDLDPATIWGIQWAWGPQYDTSYLTGTW